MGDRELYRFGPFELDPGERECRRSSEPIRLAGKPFDLLVLLVRDHGRTLTKAHLMAALWPETAVEEANLTQTVFLLRKALGDDAEHAYVRTVPRLGYKLVHPVTVSRPPVTPAVQERPARDSGFRPARIAMVCRDAELKQLTRQLDEAFAGRGSLILIGGEPGIGKTRLSTALLEAAHMRGALAMTGHCYEMEGSPPYMPFIEILEQTAREAPRNVFRHFLGEDAGEVARLMPELRRMFPDVPPPAELPAEHQRRFLFNAFRRYVERSARCMPAVALLEDLHWADEPSLLLLQHTAQTVVGIPMLMIGTYRDVDTEIGLPFTRTLEFLLRQKLATRILLPRLPAAGVEQMLIEISSRQPPPAVTRIVFKETDGNPFFVEEVFRSLAEEGKLFDENGAFRPDLQAEERRVPEGVRLFLERRLERLSVNARRILTTAAVIGRVFLVELLEDLEAQENSGSSASSSEGVLEALEEAERARLVEVDKSGRDARYRFVHELVRQTLSGTVVLPRRQKLHARVADALKRHYGSSADEHASAIAHHFYQAGSAADRETTIRFLLEATRKTSEAVAHEETLEHLSHALDLLGNERTVRVADLHARRASAMRSLSRYEEAIREYERALALFDALGEHGRFVETSAGLWLIPAWSMQFDEMNAVAGRAAQHADGASPILRGIVLGLRANTASIAGEVDRALDFLAQIHGIPEGELSPSVLGFTAGSETHARFHAGQIDLCEAAARKGTRIYEQSGEIWMRTNVELGLYAAPLQCGRPAEAERRILEALTRATRVGHDNAKFLALRSLVTAHIAKGDLELAERTAREAIAFGKTFPAGSLAFAEALLGGVLLYREQTEEAVSLLQKAARGPATFASGLPEAALAFGLAAAGNECAGNACDAAIRFLPRPGTSRSLGAWHAVLITAEALSHTGRRKEAGCLQAQAEGIAAEWDCSLLGSPARTAAGIAAACAGDWVGAEQHHRAAIARMDAVPYVTAGPIARYWFADMLIQRGCQGDAEAAKNLLEASMAASDEIGLALYARLARQRLAGI